MSEIALYPMGLSDLDGVMAVELRSFTQPWSREAFEEQVLSPFTVYITAKDGDRVVGYAGMYVVLDETHVTNIAVHPDYRGHGLGRRMMEELIRIAVARGASRMDLEVRTTNRVAQQLYLSLGFRQVGIRPAYYQLPPDDALVLRLEPLPESA
jgi:[ribosomal protein S18]-alanine N-acetyltransferase